ncbi:hypothetical protein N431DRAFT_172651 [Stipitochalara longipes BDJ]|nr:hypothetical protein N431DRAFT_172651 [Stipitochalara longipes BDJ]
MKQCQLLRTYLYAKETWFKIICRVYEFLQPRLLFHNLCLFPSFIFLVVAVKERSTICHLFRKIGTLSPDQTYQIGTSTNEYR